MATERPLTADMSEEELTKALLDNSQLEIFNDALKPEDSADDADTSLEDMEDIEGALDGETPQDEEEGDEEQDNPDDEPGELAAEADEENPDHAPEEPLRVPSARLREETMRREAIERELANTRARLAAYEVQQQQNRQPQQQEQPYKPDIFTDPDGWAAMQRAEIERDMTARHVNSALADAHEQHGDEFVAAYRSLTSLNPQDPLARATVQRIWDAPNPGKALMRWHGEQRILQETRGDPAAYRQRVAREMMSDPAFRQQVIENMRGEAMQGEGGRPRTQTRLPKSLNGASGGGNVRTGDFELYNVSEKSIFDYAMRDK